MCHFFSSPKSITLELGESFIFLSLSAYVLDFWTFTCIRIIDIGLIWNWAATSIFEQTKYSQKAAWSGNVHSWLLDSICEIIGNQFYKFRYFSILSEMAVKYWKGGIQFLSEFFNSNRSLFGSDKFYYASQCVQRKVGINLQIDKIFRIKL